MAQVSATGSGASGSSTQRLPESRAAVGVFELSPEEAEQRRRKTADIWKALEEANVLGPRVSIWYRFVLGKQRRGFILCVTFSAAGLLYLAILPDTAMVEAYGQKMARTICGAASLYMFIGCLRVSGCGKVLECQNMHDWIERFGESTNKGMQWSRLDPHSGRIFDGSVLGRIGKAGVLAIGCLAGLALAGDRASPQAVVIWVVAGIMLHVLSPPTMFATRLVQAMSKALIMDVMQDVLDFPKETTSCDEPFWEKALGRYKELDRELRNLWGIASGAYIPHFGAMYLMGLCSVTVAVQADRSENCEVEVFATFALFWCLFVTLRDLWVLSRISALCGAKSSFQEDSIFAAAMYKLGRNKMTPRQKKDHWNFLQSVEMSPTGARIFLLVDTALLTRVAVPMITADATLVSYILSTFGSR